MKRPTLRHEKKARSKGHKVIAGVDEAGVGPLAGPVVAAAVILGRHRFRHRIDDSKRLSPVLREEAYLEITTHTVWSAAVIGITIIDEINIYHATHLAMEKAVIGLRTAPDCVLVDGRAGLVLPCSSYAIPGGDRVSLSIACASIVAKVYRDRIMTALHAIFPQYSFERHKGYGTARHCKNLMRYGPSPVHRSSFAPVRNAQRKKELYEVSACGK